MKYGLFIRSFFAAMCFFLICATAFPEDNGGTPGAEDAGNPAEKITLSKSEMIEYMTNIMRNRPDVKISVEGLQAAQDEAGGVLLIYNGVKLDDLDRDTVVDIFLKVNQQVSWQNLETMRKFEQEQRKLKQMNDMQRTQKMLDSQRTPLTSPASARSQQQFKTPDIPKTYQPPSIPSTPKTSGGVKNR